MDRESKEGWFYVTISALMVLLIVSCMSSITSIREVIRIENELREYDDSLTQTRLRISQLEFELENYGNGD